MNAIYHDIDNCQQRMIQSPVAGAKERTMLNAED